MQNNLTKTLTEQRDERLSTRDRQVKTLRKARMRLVLCTRTPAEKCINDPVINELDTVIRELKL